MYMYVLVLQNDLTIQPFSSSGTWTNEERVTSQDGVGDSTVTGPAGSGR